MNDEAVPTAGKGAAAAAGPALTRRILIERVQAITGANAKDVRDVVEATLVVMGTAVRAGEVLRLPPFGIGRPRKPKEGASPDSAMMLVKTSKTPPAEKKAKAAASDAGLADAGLADAGLADAGLAEAGAAGAGRAGAGRAGAGRKGTGGRGAGRGAGQGKKGKGAGKKAKGVETPAASE